MKRIFLHFTRCFEFSRFSHSFRTRPRKNILDSLRTIIWCLGRRPTHKRFYIRRRKVDTRADTWIPRVRAVTAVQSLVMFYGAMKTGAYTQQTRTGSPLCHYADLLYKRYIGSLHHWRSTLSFVNDLRWLNAVYHIGFCWKYSNRE